MEQKLSVKLNLNKIYFFRIVSLSDEEIEIWCEIFRIRFAEFGVLHVGFAEFGGFHVGFAEFEIFHVGFANPFVDDGAEVDVDLATDGRQQWLEATLHLQ